MQPLSVPLFGTVRYRTVVNRALGSHGYDNVPFHFGPFQKAVRRGLRSHGYGKNQAVRPKTGPESGRYGKVNQKLERYDIVPLRSRVTVRYRTVLFSCEQKNRSSLSPLSGPVWFLWVTPSWIP